MSNPRHVRDRLPDEWQKCIACMGKGFRDGPVGQPTHTCDACKGTGEVLREAEPIRRRR